ncbi:MAG: sugar ABC transporter permease [Clostridium sp.]|nr:sugar ABC transporter permease [Clostridium sp.]
MDRVEQSKIYVGISRYVKNKMKISKELKNNLTAYAFLSPWIIGFLLFSGVPILACFGLSLTKWDLVGSPEFIKFQNYIEMFSADSTFWNTMKVTIIFTFLGVIVSITWALFLANLLNMKVKGIKLFQFLYFIPAVMPSVVMAFIFQLMFNKEIGIVNYFLSLIGINNGPNWLMDKNLIMPVLLFTCIYTFSTGQMMLIFSAALKEVPGELYEAADLDGAGGIRKFWSVTLPAISPIVFFNMIVSIVNFLNGSFSLIYPLTGGGPNDATNIISLDIYRNAFATYRMGYSAALSTVLFIVVAFISFVQFKASKKWVYYEE